MTTANRRAWLLLFIFGLAVLVCSLFALVYAFLPVGTLVEQTQVAPTLFAVP